MILSQVWIYQISIKFFLYWMISYLVWWLQLKSEQVVECYSENTLVILIPKHLTTFCWGNYHDSWWSYLTVDSKKLYDLSNHAKVPSLQRGIQSTNNKSSFHGGFSVISTLRRPFKLKDSTVHTVIIQNQLCMKVQ